MKEVTIYTDGACSGNPGPGGWGAILICDGNEIELSGRSPATTNNIMEMTGAVEALKSLTETCKVTIYSDSKYVVQGISEWIIGWKKKGWKNASKKPVKNKEVWLALDEQNNRHDVSWNWVKGHADNPYNNRCDELAVAAIDDFR